MSSSPRTLAFLAAACFALLWFANLQYRDLFQTDEGRYAEIPREMLASGDWVTPRLDGLKYFEKPALQYWATAATYAVFGESNWTSRLWTALTGFLGVLLTAWVGWRLFDRRTAWAAAIILASSFYYVIMGHFNTLDMGVSFFMSATLFAFLLAMQAADKEDIRARRNWMYVAWAAAALGMLSKGLEAVVLPGAVFVLYTLVARDWKRWKQLHYYGGLLIFLVIAAPWFVLVSIRNPDFAYHFFIFEHFERFLTPVAHRPGAWWYFIPILIAGVLPWWPQFVRAVAGSGKHALQAKGSSEFDPVLFMWIWVGFIFVFFSLSDSKLGSYILPIFPALALLVGRELGKLRKSDILISAALCVVMAITTLWLAPMLKHDGGGVTLDLYKAFLPWLVAGCGLLLLTAGAAFILAYYRCPCIAVGLLAAGMFISLQIITSGAQVLSPVYSGHSLVKQLGDRDTANIPFYSVDDYQQSLPFYLRRTLTLVAYQGELAFGIQREPDKWVPDLDTFTKRWQQDARALAVMPTDTYQTLLKQGLPMKVIAQDPARVIVEKP
ncbi:MAG TPA: phospholipid carrier-dependent glycosyltransferase [Gammaproteobacteria bacterium]|nr:phospholipid carrier-dependent glycosyltransferase [Gammaproteobacteria bacterium]